METNTFFEDTYRHKGMRKNLIEQLKKQGIQNTDVLSAMLRVPRHYFVNSVFHYRVYDEADPISIGEGQTISQAYTVAIQSHLLDIKKRDRILEIGTGSGYQAAVLLELGADLYSVEYNEVLHAKAKKILADMGYKASLFWKDGSRGLMQHAPYNGIIVTAGAPSIPHSLLEQLSVGGKLIIPIGDRNSQKMYRFIKKSDTEIMQEYFTDTFRFVPLLGEDGWGVLNKEL
ncbi:MAG: protein-L-isoaspartate(D-aspartate) O-methyltransferase [Chitinophagaceae bacterium]|nr:protein-L-isoaspartate(D-aspartate) O-methyltransferase [Chitinophagaceae bacterium]